MDFRTEIEEADKHPRLKSSDKIFVTKEKFRAQLRENMKNKRRHVTPKVFFGGCGCDKCNPRVRLSA